MNSIWIFGDSFSNRFDVTSEDYCEYLSYTPKSFGEILSEALNKELHICAGGGLGNQDIFISIIKKLDEIQENDIIIIGWSESIRFRLVDDNGRWISVTSHSVNVFQDYYDVRNISNNTIFEILTNRRDKLYVEEINDYIKLLNFAFNKNIVVHWTWAETNKFLNLSIPYQALPLIVKDTNREVNDYHYSENGHQKLAQLILEYINKHINKLV